MDYFDTNILLYAFTKNVDDVQQRDISISLLENAIANGSLIVLELLLCEFSFVSYKLGEKQNDIDNNLDFLSKYMKVFDFNVHQSLLTILKDTHLYASSFDVFHLAFAQEHNARLTTFDKGFKKLKDSISIEINIL